MLEYSPVRREVSASALMSSNYVAMTRETKVADALRQRRKRAAMALGAAAAAVAGIAAFHFLVMDLDVLWAKIARRMDF